MLRLALFFTVILPIISIFAVGFILQRIRVMDVRPIAAVSLYILSPALVFITLYEAEFSKDYLIIAIYMFVLFYFMVLSNKILAYFFKWEKSVESASILATGFMNSGNYGLPVVLFSLGEAALPFAIFIMVMQSLQNNFFGIYYASRSRSGISRALKNVMKMPTTYAAIFAFIFQYFNVTIPETLTDTIGMVGDAAIPVMMVLLGMQLGSIVSMKQNLQVILSGVVLKMFIAPLFAFLFISLFTVDPLIALVLIIISAMPTAATTTMYAIEFDTEPELVSSITFISTAVSIVSLSVLLNIIL